MPFTSNSLEFVRLRPAAAFASLVTLAVGVVFVTQAGSGNNNIMWSQQDPNGKQIAALTSSGNLTVSGAVRATAVIIDGISISTGASLDTRYVNVSGDTMTGALRVQANISGSTLKIDGNMTASGKLKLSGAGTGSCIEMTRNNNAGASCCHVDQAGTAMVCVASTCPANCD